MFFTLLPIAIFIDNFNQHESGTFYISDSTNRTIRQAKRTIFLDNTTL